ncbi:MAG TPA: dihydrodipicolinate reductase C-terminal domain-containing protein [Candidatus Acidoferrum sp.]|nr:dihydrodipicolinate reductase C-terminal domain-containing protein [Candidatus Acidoferrum sp.]
MSIPLAIVGYGKMGRMVEKLAPEFGFAVCARLTKAEMANVSIASLGGAAVAIEFTNGAAAPQNLRRLAKLRVNTVCGTTGWYEQLPEILDEFQAAKTGLVFGANFSVGVNLFLEIVAYAASVISKHPEYEAWGWEIHHSAKKDAPSGTLKKLAEEIHAVGFRRQLSLSSNRAGAHAGTHEIGFDSARDTITMRHTARNREGFARGALQAARWIAGKDGVHEFRKIFGELAGFVSKGEEENSIASKFV